jgi:hypothetical protein
MGLAVSYVLESRGRRVEVEAAMQRWQQRVMAQHPQIRVKRVKGARFGFRILPLPGSEPAGFLLEWEKGLWAGGDSTKTQYAALTQYGGRPHFIAAHLQIIAILDIGKELGFVKEVCDDGDYWNKRDMSVLLKNLCLNEAMVAWLVGSVKDAFGSDTVKSPILSQPNFEYLEAIGQEVVAASQPFVQADTAS